MIAFSLPKGRVFPSVARPVSGLCTACSLAYNYLFT